MDKRSLTARRPDGIDARGPDLGAARGESDEPTQDRAGASMRATPPRVGNVAAARSLATNAAWSLLCHVLGRGSLMAATALLARSIDTGSFAAYSYFQLTAAMLAAYATMGLGVAASRLFAEADATGHIAPLGTVWTLSIVLAAAGFALVVLIPHAWLDPAMRVPQWMLAMAVSALALQVVPHGAILGLERYRQAAVAAGIAGAITLAGAVGAVAAKDVRVAMGAAILSAITQSLGESAVVIRAVGWRRLVQGFALRRPDIVHVLGVSGPMFLVSLLAGSAGWAVGRIILSGPGGQHEFALFSIGLQWFAVGLLIPGMLSRVLLPRLIRGARGQRTPQESRRLVRSALYMATGAAGIIAATGIVLGPWIFALYGPRYHTGTDVLAVFLLAAVASAPANSLGNALVAKNGQWQWLALTIVWGAVLVAAACLLRTRGAWGGGATYVLAYAVLTMGAFIAVRRRSLI